MLHPVYELGAEFGVPVMIHTGDTFTRTAKVRYAHPLAVDDIELTASTRVVTRAGQPIELTAVEFDLLEALMKVAGTVVRREDLVRTVLGREFSPFDRSLDTHVCNLRRKIGHLRDGTERIKGIRGTGYLYAKPLP